MTTATLSMPPRSTCANWYAAVLPTSVADLDHELGNIPGTDLPGLIRRLCPDAGTAEQTLRNLIAQVEELAAAPTADEQ